MENLLNGFLFGRKVREVNNEDWMNICSGICFKLDSLYSQYGNSESINISLCLLDSLEDYIDRWEMYDRLFDKERFGDSE